MDEVFFSIWSCWEDAACKVAYHKRSHQVVRLQTKKLQHTAVVWLLGSLVKHMMNDEKANCTPGNRWRFIAIGHISPYNTTHHKGFRTSMV